MPTIADPESLRSLLERLGKLRPDAQRKWGTMSPAEMLCHIGDSQESMLQIRIPPGPPPSGKPRRFVKWLVVYSPMPMPKGVTTRPGVNPKIDGTKPSDFERDRARAITSLKAIAEARDGALAPFHFRFGPMSTGDWRHLTYKHVDHHLRQFGA